MEKIKELNKQFAQLWDDASTWRQHYQELSDYIAPEVGRYLQSTDEKDGKHNSGKKLNSKIINGTATDAQGVTAAGLQSGLTSPSRPWFVLTLSDESLADEEEVKLWLHNVREKMLAVLAGSNFYSSIHNVFEELPTFATSAMFIDEDFDTVVRFTPLTVGSYLIANDERLRSAILHRQFVFSADQLVKKFGIENVSKQVKSAYENNLGQTSFEVIHAIQPNPDFTDGSDKPEYLSFYFEKTAGEDLLRESQYKSKPFVVSRWSLVGTDSYGRRSPGMKCLGDVKMLQKLEEKKLKAIDKMVDPPLNAPIELQKKGTTLVAGGVNYYDGLNGRRPVEAVHLVNLDINQVRQEIRDVEVRIDRFYFNDLFRDILDQQKQMTATEIVQRHADKLILIGPVVERLQSEFLDGIIDRVFSVMDDMGLIPEPPRQLQGQEIKVDYIGVLAQAQKVVGVTAIEQIAGFVGNLAAANPEILDKFNFDEAVDQYAEAIGVPPALVRSEQAVEVIRNARAQAQQAQQMQETMMNAAQGAKLLSETDSGGNNALNALMSANQ